MADRRPDLRHGIVTVVVAGLVLLTGCERVRETFGLNRSAPDEFAVVTRAPLHVPPDLRLRPPTPGAPRPQEAMVSESARAILVGEAKAGTGGPSPVGTASRGEAALLTRAGAVRPDPSIRSTVDREAAVESASGNGLLSRILFWREKEQPGLVIDAAKESRRIQENMALGENVTKGPVPVIERREKGLLEGLF